ncbi:hypothetical protein TIFTF001_032938 [Ficus carica]|uniref:Uncharacterized protein n=1 Tax=Ficus carica TaxID=3494 RepID=A0AA88J728_FICCA|nr:hypothetical protein TIFTF001_032938 [Ficus carica]
MDGEEWREELNHVFGWKEMGRERRCGRKSSPPWLTTMHPSLVGRIRREEQNWREF